MILCHYITPQTIVVPAAGETKLEVITHLTEALAQRHRLKHSNKILKAVLAREDAGSTFLPIGVAIPHARYHEIDEIKMVLGILPNGIVEPFDGKMYPIYLVALFISPASEQNFGRHLKLLARIAAVFHDTTLVKALAAAKTPNEAFDMLQRFERQAEEAQSLAREGAAALD